MIAQSVLFPMLKADFLERTRCTNFLITLCLVIYLGYAVNSGQILIKLDSYRGVYNSAWVGSLMAVVITFFLGMIGFYLVKDTIERDERTGVGQILATTPLTRSQYMLGKWLSNFAVLASLVVLLALAAILMQIIHREVLQIQVWSLVAPLLFIALPMMALVAAFAVFFETLPWLKGGFGNLVYFLVFAGLFIAAIFLTQAPWLDVTGITLVGASMKAGAKAAFPTYDNSFVLAMIADKPLQTFLWTGLHWTIGLILQRLLWLVVSIAIVLLGSLFFNRFDPDRYTVAGKTQKPAASLPLQPEDDIHNDHLNIIRLTPLPQNIRFHSNFLRLVWLEILLLVKGLKWYWWIGMAGLWIGCVISPSGGLRKYWFMLVTIWPVLLWSRMGERETRYQTGQLIYQATRPLLRLLGSSWLAGVMITAVAATGILLGRLISGEPIALLSWVLSVVFIPTLALALGVWGGSSKLFEVIYPILWYLGPFNRENGLAMIDYLGIHTRAAVNTSPLLVVGFILLLLFLAFEGQKRRIII